MGRFFYIALIGSDRFFVTYFVIIAFLFSLQGSIVWSVSSTQFPNFDEIAHLPAGISVVHLRRFDLYAVNPPLVKVVVGCFAADSEEAYPWWLITNDVRDRSEFRLGRELLGAEKTRIQSRFIAARRACFIISIVSGIVFLFFIRSLLGPCPALVLAIYWCLCPNLVANSATIGPDIAAVALGVVTSYTCYRYVLSPCLDRALFGGLAFGFALLTKLTWVTGFFVFPIVAAVCIFVRRPSSSRVSLGMFIMDGFSFCVVALLTLNAGYVFEGSFAPLRSYEFCSEMLGGKGCNFRTLGNRFKDTWLGYLPIPFPKNYILGIDYLKMEVEQKYWSFLLGEWKKGSWPHYYLITTLLKTPEPTLLGAALGLGVLIVGIWRKMVKPEVISMFLFLIIPAAVCFASVSLQGGFNHHHRYVLMIYPPMFALAAYIASPVGIQLLRFRLPFLGPDKRSIAVPLALTLAVLSAASSLRVHPYYTSYFNTLSGGPENGWRLLGFSNIDWGQDILEVDKWLKAHPDRRPLVMDIDYFGMNGNLFDVTTSMPPKLPKGASVDEVRRSITETQWWIISVKKLYNLPDQKGLEYLQQLQPVEKIAYAYHVYRIDPLPADPTLPDLKLLQE